MGATILLCFTLTLGQIEEKPKPKEEPVPVFKIPPATAENEAMALALVALQPIPQYDRRYMRFIWVTSGQLEDLQATSLAVNMVSTKNLIRQPLKLGNNRLLLCMLDLRRYARIGLDGDTKDLDRLLRTWEEFRFEPRYNLLLTRNTLDFAEGINLHLPEKDKKRLVGPKHIGNSTGKTKKEWKLVDSKPWTQNGKTYTKHWIEVDIVGDSNYVENSSEDVVRVIGEHINKALLVELIDATHSQAPIVTEGYFVFRALSSIKDFQKDNKDNLYATLFGGLYYDLANIPQNSVKGSDEDNLLAQLGIGNIKEGISSKQFFDDLDSDQRTAMFKSAVTGSGRLVEYLPTAAVREKRGAVIITRDVKRRSIDLGQTAMFNLLTFRKADGAEILFVKPNGLQGGGAYDGKGKILQAVASDIATDRTVPIPHSTDLQAIISCMACHGPEGGWRLARNEVKLMVGKRFDILNDANFNGFGKQYSGDRTQLFDRLAGLYSGDLEREYLPSLRRNTANAVLEATGPWKESKSQVDVTKIAYARVRKIFNEYAYTSITPQKALSDLGIASKTNKEAAAILRVLWKPLPSAIVPNEHTVNRYDIQEDPRAIALMQEEGLLSINPHDWALFYGFGARRAQLSGAWIAQQPLPKQLPNKLEEQKK